MSGKAGLSVSEGSRMWLFNVCRGGSDDGYTAGYYYGKVNHIIITFSDGVMVWWSVTEGKDRKHLNIFFSCFSSSCH